MLRRFICVLMSGLLISASLLQPAMAETREEKQLALAEKVKAGIVSMGIGRDSRVELKLRNRTKVKGYVSAIGDDHFVVTDLKDGASTTVAWPDVTGVKGNNLTSGAKIAIGAAIGAGAVILVLLLIINSAD